MKRITKEAKRLGIFDKIIAYTHDDLPLCLKSSPLMMYNRGDGYWSWKPYLIWHTMQLYPQALVVYVDAGCTLTHNFDEWNAWFSLAESTDTIVFRYQTDGAYSWNQVDRQICRNKFWMKSSLVDYFQPMMHNTDWLEKNQVLAGLILARKQSPLIRQWNDVVLFHPDLVFDVYGNESTQQPECFIEHRHDQSVLSACVCVFENDVDVVRVLPETAESSERAAVVATRKMAAISDISRKTRLIRKIKKVFGEKAYSFFHKLFGSTKLCRKIQLILDKRK